MILSTAIWRRTGWESRDGVSRETIMKARLELGCLILLALILARTGVQGQGSAMNYRGQLTTAGAPADGPHDMEFRLFPTADVDMGAQLGDTKSLPAVPVTNGTFVVSLDFGAAVFDGSLRFLEIGVRPPGSVGPYITLSPRQQVASIPYAIRSLSAGTATSLANGAGVQSLNNLKDHVTLAAGPNITITPSGRTLTIEAAGGGGGGPWSLSGADTFYNAGNVGIGTSTLSPGMRLEVSGATLLKPGNGNIQFGSPNAELGFSIIPNAGNRADLRFDGAVLKLLAGAGAVPPSTANGIAITTDGNVGIGNSSPALGYRLDVSGATRLSTGNGTVQFGTPNAELGLSITPNAGNRADLRFDGSLLKLVASTGEVPPSSDNGLAITTAGRVGIGTSAPDAKLHVETTQPGTVVYGLALGTGGVGVYGRAPNLGGIGALGSAGPGGTGIYAENTAGGTALHADGNATQAHDKGGFVKAMAYIDPFLPEGQYVVRCYNSSQAGNASSTSPCGITVTRGIPGNYTINFGFNVEGRFISLTAQASGTFPPTLVGGFITIVSGSQVAVTFIRTGGSSRDEEQDSRFHVIVY